MLPSGATYVNLPLLWEYKSEFISFIIVIGLYTEFRLMRQVLNLRQELVMCTDMRSRYLSMPCKWDDVNDDAYSSQHLSNTSKLDLFFNFRIFDMRRKQIDLAAASFMPK